MTIKKLFKPRILFPTVILLLLISSFILSVILAPSPFHVEQIDNPGDVKISWEEISEEEFYENMTVAMNVTFEKEPTYYSLKEPGSDVEMPIAQYDVTAYDIFASPRTQPNLSAGETYRVHGTPSAFSDRGVTTVPEKNSFVLFLCEQRDCPNFVPREGVSPTYYDDYFNTLGYSVITPAVYIFPVDRTGEEPRIETALLPDYLQGEGEYTTFFELWDILAEGRAKYGMSEYNPWSDAA